MNKLTFAPREGIQEGSTRSIKQKGFTIVELLIVIVVIGILAAISIVSYNGIQNRANDTAVQNDLAGLAKAIHMIKADTGEFPEGGSKQASSGATTTGAVQTGPIGLKYPVNTTAHKPVTGGGAANLIYCRGPSLTTSEDSFALYTLGVSGTNFFYSYPGGTTTPSKNISPNISRACANIGYPRSISYSYFTNSGGWQAWTK